MLAYPTRTLVQRAAALVACAALSSCGDRGSAPAPQAVAPAQRVELRAAPADSGPGPGEGPPQRPYVAPQPWRSRAQPPEVVAAPDPAAETWRAFANQAEPIQRETPHWQPLPAPELVVLQMPPDSGFRCVVTPLETSAESNDFGTKLKGWRLRRSLLCSADAWRSWTEYPHEVRLLPDGTRQAVATQALLRERSGAGRPRETLVLVRDDREQREATTGPPRILPGVAVDEE